MALDPNLAALLTISVNYYPRTGTDEFGQEEWGAAVPLKCYPTMGVRQVERPDGTEYISRQALYFDSSDPHVQTFQLGDRFQAPGIAGGQTLEAQMIETQYSPGPSLNEPMSAWMTEVLL